MNVIYLFEEEWEQLRQRSSVRKERIDPFRIRVGRTVFMLMCDRYEDAGWHCTHPIPESHQCEACPARTPGK